MGLRLISETVPKLTGNVFSRKYIALGRIFSYWNEIVGSDMASRAQPVKIHYRRPKAKTRKPEALLEIAATSSDAAIMQYQTGLILERINQLFGDDWITAIRFVHVPANTANCTDNAHQKRELSDNEKNGLDVLLDAVTDYEIKERLKSLGYQVLVNKGRKNDESNSNNSKAR